MILCQNICGTMQCILRQNSPIYDPYLSSKGIKTLKDVTDGNCNNRKWEYMSDKYQLKAVDFLSWYRLLNSIPKHWKKKLQVEPAVVNTLDEDRCLLSVVNTLDEDRCLLSVVNTLDEDRCLLSVVNTLDEDRCLLSVVNTLDEDRCLLLVNDKATDISSLTSRQIYYLLFMAILYIQNTGHQVLNSISQASLVEMTLNGHRYM